MNTALKLGIALLSGFMFMTPIGCAQSVQAATKPAHPCCPNPLSQIPNECARPGCAYVKVKPMIVEAPASIDHELVAAPNNAIVVQQPHDLLWSDAADLHSLARDHRFLTFHQLLL